MNTDFVRCIHFRFFSSIPTYILWYVIHSSVLYIAKYEKNSQTLHSSRRQTYVSFAKRPIEIVETRLTCSIEFPTFMVYVFQRR